MTLEGQICAKIEMPIGITESRQCLIEGNASIRRSVNLHVCVLAKLAEDSAAHCQLVDKNGFIQTIHE